MQERIDRLQAILAQKKLDAILVSNFYNILYLTGFRGLSDQEREAWAIVTKDKVYLLTDGRYFNQMKNEKGKMKNLSLKLITPKQTVADHLKEIIHEQKIKTLGFEADDLTVAEYQKFSKALEVYPERNRRVQFSSTERVVLTIRSIKELEEIAKITKACELADRCLAQVIKTVSVGQTEKTIAGKIESWLKSQNSGLAFDPIVAIDANSALPHYNTKAKGLAKVKKGSIILIDFGASYQDYLSDMTRIIFVKPQGSEILKIYDVLARAQERAINMLKKTNDAKKIDSTARNLSNFKFPFSISSYPHSTGHGLGLEIHELPKISPVSTTKLVKGQVFTIEPGVYLPGKFGMRIEDTVWMKDDHKPEVLTKFAKRTIII